MILQKSMIVLFFLATINSSGFAVEKAHSSINLITERISASEIIVANSQFVHTGDYSPFEKKVSDIIRYGNDQWFLPCVGGLLRFDSKSKKVSFYFPPLVSHTYSDLNPEPSGTSIAVLKGKILFGMTDKIYLFNPQKSLFESSFTVAKSTDFGEGRNVKLTQDPETGDVWIRSFGHIDLFKAEDDSIVNWDHDFQPDKPGSASTVFLDHEYTWVASNRRNGGVHLFEKEDRSWEMFRRELFGTSIPVEEGISIPTFIASQKYLWVYFSDSNTFNFYLAVYDKKKKEWKSYQRANISSGIDLLIQELPNCYWVGKRPVLNELESILQMVPIYEPYYSPDEVQKIRQAVVRLRAAYQTIDSGNKWGHGYSPYFIQDGWVMARNKNGVDNKKFKIEIPQVAIEAVLAVAGSKIVVQTYNGDIGVIDIPQKILRFCEPNLEMRNIADFSVCPNNQVLLRSVNEDPESGETSEINVRLDLQRMSSEYSQKKSNFSDCEPQISSEEIHLRGMTVKKNVEWCDNSIT